MAKLLKLMSHYLAILITFKCADVVPGRLVIPVGDDGRANVIYKLGNEANDGRSWPPLRLGNSWE